MSFSTIILVDAARLRIEIAVIKLFKEFSHIVLPSLTTL